MCLGAGLACTGGSDDSETDTDTDMPTSITVRVATWNVQEIGTASSEQYIAAADVLRRIDADIVALNEIDGDELDLLGVLAAELNYDFVFVPDDNPFGDLRNGILSRYEIIAHQAYTAQGLSNDANANDVTRLPIEVEIDLPNVLPHLVVVAQHWKAGFGSDDTFRRLVDGQRTGQVAARWHAASDWLVVMGDGNAELDSVPESPEWVSAVPSGMPSSYRLGADLADTMRSDGLQSNPFGALIDLGLEAIPATQMDGRDYTRPSSQRRLDYIFASVPVCNGDLASEVYDSMDEQFQGLAKAGSALERTTSSTASDHFPVIAEFTLQTEP